MHPEVSHAPVLPIELGDTLPVDKLLRINIRGVKVTALDFDKLSEVFFKQRVNNRYAARVEWKFGCAAN